jgi:hypothetical protein
LILSFYWSNTSQEQKLKQVNILYLVLKREREREREKTSLFESRYLENPSIQSTVAPPMLKLLVFSNFNMIERVNCFLLGKIIAAPTSLLDTFMTSSKYMVHI